MDKLKENKKEENFGKYSQYKQNRKITIAIKKKAIEYAKLKNNAEAAKIFGVSTKSIRRWRKNELAFNIVSDPTKRITLHKGIFKADYETEKKIYDWIIFNRSLGNMISTWAVAIEFIKADIKYKNYKPKSLFMKVYRFLKRFNLSIRAGTHIGQQLPQDSKDLILKFLHKVITIRKTYNINKENIINVDETALSYNMPFNKTIHKCGTKTICIRTQRQEKCRISILLSIAGDGNKLMPYAIFKGAANGKIINILNKSKYVTEKRCICQANKNAWSCNSIIIDWINKVYIPYFTVKNV